MKEFTGQIKEHDPGRWERLVRMVRERDAARQRGQAIDVAVQPKAEA